MCNEIKLSQQIKKHNLNEKKQLGQVCGQFGVENPSTSQANDKISKHKNKEKFYDLLKRKHRRRKERREPRKEKRKAKMPPIVCRKCGKIGHKASKCWVKKKLNTLEIDDDLKETLSKLLLNSETEEEPLITEGIEILENDSSYSDSEECEPCKSGQPCENKDSSDSEDGNNLYQIISQF